MQMRAFAYMCVIFSIFFVADAMAAQTLVYEQPTNNTLAIFINDNTARIAMNFTFDTDRNVTNISIPIRRIGIATANRYASLNCGLANATGQPDCTDVDAVCALNVTANTNTSHMSMSDVLTWFNFSFWDGWKATAGTSYVCQLFAPGDPLSGSRWFGIGAADNISGVAFSNYTASTAGGCETTPCNWGIGPTNYAFQVQVYAETVSDTCTAPGSGAWTITDNCDLSTSQQVPGDLILAGAAGQRVTVSSWLRFTGASQRIIINSGTSLQILAGGRIG